MGMVHTVLGPVSPKQLGITLMHEHIVFEAYERPVGQPGYDPQKVIEAVSAELVGAVAEGVQTLVDATPIGNERLPQAQAEIARRTGLNIIASTGFWCDPPLFHLTGTDDVDALADLMVKEIQEGMDGTGFRAGIIKVATSAVMTDGETRALCAAARASQRTGASITTHTHRGALALEQVDFFEREGADLGRVIIGHIGGTPDLNLHQAVADRGVCLGYDRTGQGHEQDDEAVLNVFVEMVRRGYQRQLTLSQDTSVFLFGVQRPPLAAHLGGHSMHERPAYTHLWHQFIPRVLACGVTEQDMRTILVDNPSRLLSLAH